MPTRKISDNLLNRSNGSYDLTIAGFDYDFGIVDFTDGSFLILGHVSIIAFVCFWNAFFTRDQFDQGVTREDTDKLIGTNVRVEIFDKQTRADKTVRVTNTVKL
jgi:hypothetical protein